MRRGACSYVGPMEGLLAILRRGTAEHALARLEEHGQVIMPSARMALRAVRIAQEMGMPVLAGPVGEDVDGAWIVSLEGLR